MVDKISNMQLADLNYKPYSGKVSKILLIVPSTPDSILPQDHFNINFFVWASVLGKPTPTVRKNEKSDIKEKIIFSAHNHTIKACTDQI